MAADIDTELQRSERRFRTLATATSAVIWITAPNGEVLADLPSWETFTGQTYARYQGWGWLEAIHPDDRDRVLAHWQQSMAQGALNDLAYRLRRHDGVYRDVVAHGAPVLDDAGMVVEWIGHCTDVTESRARQAALRDSEERFRFLDALGQAARETTDAAEVMAVTTRLLGEHLGTARCAYADVEPDNDRFTIRNDWSAPGVASSAGVYSLDLFGPQAQRDMRGGQTMIVNDVDRELGPTGGADMFNAIGVKAIICSPLVKHGRLIAMMAVHHHVPRRWTDNDVALVQEVVERCWAHIERVRDAAALREQDRRKDEFLATLAHELRNPLAPVRYATSLLRLSTPGGPTAARAQDVIDRQVGLMVRLIDDLLDLSRVSRGLIELRKAPVELSQVVELAVETSRPYIQAASHQLDVRLPAEPVVLLADDTRLAQVISNLLNNAAKYTPDGGRLQLSAWMDDASGRVSIEVADNGIGIPPEQQGRLFEMFARLPHSAQRSQGGLGIGLSLVKRLVEMHDGTVSAFSAGLDEGSRFQMSLPVLTPAGGTESATETLATPGTLPTLDPEDATGPASRPRVLVVEDNPDGLETLLELLDILGYEAQGAPTGQAALGHLAAFRPQAVLMDIGLPDMSGYELARQLRTLPGGDTLPLIALTGWGGADDRRKATEAGFDHHLTKPVDPDTLESLLVKSTTVRSETS